jgi:hypothetical protein
MDSRPKPGSSKSRQPLDLFIKSMRGEHPFGHPGCEYCAELSSVSQHLPRNASMGLSAFL